MRIFSLSKISQLWIQATVMMCLVLFSACGKDLEKETFDVYLIDKDSREKSRHRDRHLTMPDEGGEPCLVSKLYRIRLPLLPQNP